MPQVQTLELPYQSATVDTRFEPLASILQHVSGSTWTLQAYYSQFVDADNESSPHQISRPAAYQQYIRINGLEVKVTTPLSESQDPETKSFEVTGNARIFSGLIPNKGDVFVADIGDGRQGLFTVTSSDRKTHLKNSGFEIAYQLKEFLKEATQQDLDAKTVKTVKFIKDLLYFDHNANLLNTDFSQRVDLYEQSKKLVDYYFRDFFSIEHSTFLIPGQSKATYDPWLVRFLTKILGTNEHRLMQRIKVPSTDLPEYRNTTLWDCIQEGSDFALPYAQFKMRAVSTSYFRARAQIGGIYYTSIEQILFPYDGRTDVDRFHDQCVGVRSTGTGIGNAGDRPSSRVPSDKNITYVQLEGLPLPGELDLGESIPDFSYVLADDSYVLSNAFYKGQTPLKSNLERLVLQLLKDETIERETLCRISNTVMYMPELERFYFIPLILTLIRVALRTN